MSRSLSAGRLNGTLRVPGSKSLTNRALVAAALLPGESLLVDPLDADDTRVLAACLKRLGATVVPSCGLWRVSGPLAAPDEEVLLDVGPAGTPARFLLALAAALPGRFVLDGSARMRERPMGPLVEALRGLGASFEPLGREGFLPLRIVGGSLRPGKARLPGGVSSQFVSALLLAAPLVPGGLEVEVEGPLASAEYVALTRAVSSAFSRGPCQYVVPGDDSAACFPIAGAVASGGRVELLGLVSGSRQPDAVFREWARAAGAVVSWENEGGMESAKDDGSLRLVVDAFTLVRPRPVNVDVDPAPDAALPLAAMVAFAGGRSRLSGARRLREKESDRLAAAVDLLSRAGALAGEEDEPAGGVSLLVDGEAGGGRRADFVAHGDHRVAMSAAVLALSLPPGSTLDDPDVVTKSWPGFWKAWSGLISPSGSAAPG